MKKIMPMALIAMPLLLSACSTASGGTQALKTATPESLNQTIHDGVTTADQIKALYGAPEDVSYTDNGSEVWHYMYEQTGNKIGDASLLDPTGISTFLGSKSKSHNRSLILLIKNGIVVKHTFNDAKKTIGTGIFRQ